MNVIQKETCIMCGGQHDGHGLPGISIRSAFSRPTTEGSMQPRLCGDGCAGGTIRGLERENRETWFSYESEQERRIGLEYEVFQRKEEIGELRACLSDLRASMVDQKPKRDPVSPALRFTILDRDRRTCQYCGAKAPDVVLHVDHVISVADGGATEESNLVTACRECNLGKGRRSA